MIDWLIKRWKVQGGNIKKVQEGERVWVLVTNSDFLIPISWQPNFVDLIYFNQGILLDQIILVWNSKVVNHQVAKM